MISDSQAMPTPKPAIISYPISWGIVKSKRKVTNKTQAATKIEQPMRANGLKNGTIVDTAEKINVPTVIVAANGNDSSPLVRGATPFTNFNAVSATTEKIILTEKASPVAEMARTRRVPQQQIKRRRKVRRLSIHSYSTLRQDRILGW